MRAPQRDFSPAENILERLAELHPRRIDLSLGRIARVLAALGNPERALPPVVHVSGTNGKGSVIAFLTAILAAAGRSTHVFTSPHLVRFNERIRVAGQPIDDDTLTAALTACERANAGGDITVFEI
ncbi:MAG: bifunctional folylpolyglutamate synthase/dihydrofolate synthase, partial [Alphaproteobacteria bacterium]